MKAWKDYLEKARNDRDRESGFSLVEIMIAVVVIGLLVGIAVPVWMNMQNEMNSRQIKTQLQQIGVLLETEALDNNGLYPEYIPNEVLKITQTAGSNDNNIKKVIYTYSPDRIHWCVQTDSPMGRLFVSDTNKEPSGDQCTLDIVGKNSDTPWATPTVPKPSIKTFTNTWANTASQAVASVAINPITCNLGADTSDWGSEFRIEYSIRILNTTRSTPVINATAWNTATTVSIPLNGWLPDDNMTVDVRARCITNYSGGYSYNSDYSSQATGKVAWFTVEDVAWTTNPTVTWGLNAVPSYTAGWTATAFCPSGTPGYALNVTGTWNATGATGVFFNQGTATAPATWASSWTQNLGADAKGGTPITSNHKVVCKLSDGRMKASTGITYTTPTTPIKAPTAVPTISSNNGAGSTSVYPNRIAWAGGGTCQVGTLQYLVTRTAPSTATILNWGTALTSNQTHVAGTAYTYTVAARCVSGSTISAVRGTGTTTFTAAWNIPPVPAGVTGFANNGNGTLGIKNDQLTWNAVTCSFSTPEYLVRQTVKGNVAIADASRPNSGWITTNSYNLPAAWMLPGNTVQFEVAARCKGSGGTSAQSAYATAAGARWTTAINAPSAPRSVSVVRTGVTTWAAPTTVCQAGATLQYQIRNVTTGTDSGWITALSGTAPSWSDVGGNSYNVNVKARCAGVNANSGNSAVLAASVSIPYKQAWTSSNGGSNCSNYRSGPGTGYSVYGCYDPWGGTLETLYNYCNADGYTWFRTGRGWTVSGNLENATTQNVLNQC